MKIKKILSIMLAVVLMATALAACSSRDAEPGDADDGEKSSSTSKEKDKSGDTVSSIIQDATENVLEMKEINEDVVGWLSVPNTDIGDVVLQRIEHEDYRDNDYYARINIHKEKDFNGVYFADFRDKVRGATGKDLNVSTCIYGHALTDDPEDSRYDIRFAPLHNFRDSEFAKENPYFFFSTEEEDMVFEIIAVFVANSDNPDLAYNFSPEDPKDYVKMIEKEVYPRSYYDYGVKISEKDKFMSLSTCIYELEGGTTIPWPGSFMRYIVMGRLVDPDAPLKEEANIKENKNQVFDPDGKWAA